jgi:very-short-patch-repair endonuclease
MVYGGIQGKWKLKLWPSPLPLSRKTGEGGFPFALLILGERKGWGMSEGKISPHPYPSPEKRERGEKQEAMVYKHRIRTTAGVQQHAKELRKKMTPAEKILWERLRDRQLGEFKFRRQHPLGPFIADFYCAEKRLVVEIDGDIHEFQKNQDEQRTHQFEEYGYRVIRFQNVEIETNLFMVLNKILKACQLPSPTRRESIPLSPNGERSQG